MKYHRRGVFAPRKRRAHSVQAPKLLRALLQRSEFSILVWGACVRHEHRILQNHLINSSTSSSGPKLNLLWAGRVLSDERAYPRKAGGASAARREFLQFVLSRAGQRIVHETGFGGWLDARIRDSLGD